MPIKVRCQSCEAVMSVSDQAAGKAVKCRQCGERVRVPAGGPAKAPKKRKVEEDDDPFGGMNLRSVEDENRRVCPACATAVKLDDIECPKCGVTIATGVLSERQRRRIERKGPPPEEFYADVWGNAGKFLKKHVSFAIRTALVWALTLSMSITSLYSLHFYVSNRVRTLDAEVEGNQDIQRIDAYRIRITVPEDKGSNVVYDGTYYTTAGQKIILWAPHVQAWREPPTVFWMAMTLVFQLGFGGWAWTMATKIAALTMAGEKKIKRFQSDFFGNLTLGFRAYFWPTVLTVPILIVAGLIGAFVNPLVGGIIAAAAQFFPLLVLPAAVVHMAQRFSYRAWLPTWMLKDFLKTAAASLYVFAMNVFLVFALPVGLIIAIAVTSRRLLAFLDSQQTAILEWLRANVVGFSANGNLEYLFYKFPLVFGSSFLLLFIICLIVSFPAIFMMRVIGLYGVYFRTDLSLVNEFPDLEPAGFGPRYLAFIIDLIIMTLWAGVGFFIGGCFSWLFNFYGWSIAGIAGNGVGVVATLYIWSIYFSRGESGSARATLGKWSIGMVVLRDDNKPQTKQEATGRAFFALLTMLTMFLGFLMCVFRPDKKALHDLMSKTKVVWQNETT